MLHRAAPQLLPARGTPPLARGRRDKSFRIMGTAAYPYERCLKLARAMIEDFVFRSGSAIPSVGEGAIGATDGPFPPRILPPALLPSSDFLQSELLKMACRSQQTLDKVLANILARALGAMDLPLPACVGLRTDAMTLEPGCLAARKAMKALERLLDAHWDRFHWTTVRISTSVRQRNAKGREAYGPAPDRKGWG